MLEGKIRILYQEIHYYYIIDNYSYRMNANLLAWWSSSIFGFLRHISARESRQSEPITGVNRRTGILCVKWCRIWWVIVAYCVQLRMSLINSDFSFEHRKLGFYEITDTTQMKHFTKKEKRAEQRGSLKFPRIWHLEGVTDLSPTKPSYLMGRSLSYA